MKLAAVIALAFALGACTPSTDEQAHRDAEHARVDAKRAAHDVKVGAERAGKELDKDLHTAREKVRGALDQPADKDHR